MLKSYLYYGIAPSFFVYLHFRYRISATFLRFILHYFVLDLYMFHYDVVLKHP